MIGVMVEAVLSTCERRHHRALYNLLVSYALPTPKTKKHDFSEAPASWVGWGLRCRSPKKINKNKENTGARLP